MRRGKSNKKTSSAWKNPMFHCHHENIERGSFPLWLQCTRILFLFSVCARELKKISFPTTVVRVSWIPASPIIFLITKYFLRFQSHDEAAANIKFIKNYENPAHKKFRKSASTRSDFFLFLSTLQYFILFYVFLPSLQSV